MNDIRSKDNIEIIGASENNLKNISVSIPKGELVVLAGVSGSGKSSLAFDTIAVEASRQWQQSYPMYVRNKMPHYDRPHLEEIRNLTPAIVIDQQPIGQNSRSTVGTAVDVAPLLRLLFSRVGNPSAGGSMAYSFNHPMGMCPECTGIGERLELVEETMFDPDKTLEEGAILFSQFSSGWQTHLYQNNPLLDPARKLADFSDREWEILKYGCEDAPKIGIKSNNTGRVDMVDYEGVLPRFERLYLRRDISKLRKKLQDEIMSHVRRGPCPVCGGSGLNPAALQSKINDRNIVECMKMSAEELLDFLQGIDDPLGSSLASQIADYLKRMIRVGIGYLSLDRKTDTLSGGEAQRLKIVRNLGGYLNNITYIFDEPTAGLHPADAEQIVDLLTELRDQNNNVLVVEHSLQMIESADHIIEMGTAAGSKGGQVIFQGDPQLLKDADTLTAKSLKSKLEINKEPLAWDDAYEIKGASMHNLKNIDVRIPKGILTAITGVAGSGKSTLMRYEFPGRYPEAIVIDQKPIGTSIRSTPATYTGLMDEIRKVFGKANKVSPSWFSYNSRGACPVCGGKGVITYDMAFADAVTVPCEECGGHRYNPTALSYLYKGMNIEEVMDLTVSQAIEFFESRKIKTILQGLMDVGLEYLTLGQPTSTLSGGEVQRIKLASNLNRQGEVYVFDEPSIGLHNSDIGKLLVLFRKLVDGGNTVVIVEHRQELIMQADWIIDMGPGGGSAGGQVVFSGRPMELLKCADSQTAEYVNYRLG